MAELRKKGEHDKTLQEAKKKLLERKEQLEEQLIELSQTEDSVDQVQDPGDQAQSHSLETLKISLQDTELAEYNMIKQALQMIELGTYGVCTDCEQPISEKRLKLYPNATRCINCQELVEEKQKR
ncbi:MAG: TraR/DksA C4-type zinc finger protein [Candidatus Babeliales bacterium]